MENSVKGQVDGKQVGLVSSPLWAQAPVYREEERGHTLLNINLVEMSSWRIHSAAVPTLESRNTKCRLKAETFREFSLFSPGLREGGEKTSGPKNEFFKFKKKSKV